MGKKKRSGGLGSRVKALVLTLVFLVSTITGSIASTLPADAKIARDMTDVEMAQTTSYYSALYYCFFFHAPESMTINTSDENNYSPDTLNWFSRGTDPTAIVYPDGTKKCTDIATAALTLWGITPKDMLEGIGYKNTGGTNPKMERVRKDQETANNAYNSISQAFQSFVKSKLGASLNYSGAPATGNGAYDPGNPPAPAVYRMYYDYFGMRCSASDLGVYSSLKGSNKERVDQGYYEKAQTDVSAAGKAGAIVDGNAIQYGKVTVVAANGTQTEEHGFSYDGGVYQDVSGKSKDTKTPKTYVAYGYHEGAAVQGGGEQLVTKKSCTETIELIQSSAAGWVAWNIDKAAKAFCAAKGYQNITFSGGSISTLNACIAGVIDQATGSPDAALCNTKYAGNQANIDACKVGQTEKVEFDKATEIPKPDDGCQPGEDCTEESKSTCGIDGIGWIVCPVVTFLGDITDGMFDYIASNFLQTNVTFLKTDGNNAGTYIAWGIMRNIANVAFVIVFLVIIFSQMTGLGVANYGVKKMLPRLVLGAILVNLSFFICQLAVDLSNIVGFGLKTVLDNIAGSITQAAGGVGGDINGTEGFSLWKTIISGVLIAGAATAAVAAGVGSLVAVLVAALIAVATIFFILIIRQVLIILLIVIAPLAFVAFLLPNTENLFTQWRKLFTTLLLLFPITGLIFGASSLASSVLKTAYSGSNNTIGQVIAAGALMIPLFVVPFILKSSLDGIGQLGSIINKRSGKFAKNASKSAKTWGDNSRLGKFQAYRNREKERRRALIQSGQYKTDAKNPIATMRKLASKANSGLNKASGNFGNRLAASGVEASNKMFDEEVAAAAQLFKSKNPNPTELLDSAGEELKTAIDKGDAVRAHAAQNLLLSGGARGIQTLHDSLESIYGAQGGGDKNSSVASGLRNALNAAGLKDKDVRLNDWAFNSKNLSDSLNAGTIAGLNGPQLAGQGLDVLQKAAEQSLITNAQARDVMSNDNVWGALDENKKVIFRAAAGIAARPAGSGDSGLLLPGDDGFNIKH